MIRSGRLSTPGEAQLDKECREEREEWSVSRQQDGAFDRAPNRFARHNRIDRRCRDRQRSARELCERRRDEGPVSSVAIAAAAHGRRLWRLGFVAPVMGCGLLRHVSCTRGLIAGRAERQRQHRRAQEHGDNRQHHPRAKTTRQGHVLPYQAGTVPCNWFEEIHGILPLLGTAAAPGAGFSAGDPGISRTACKGQRNPSRTSEQVRP